VECRLLLQCARRQIPTHYATWQQVPHNPTRGMRNNCCAAHSGAQQQRNHPSGLPRSSLGSRTLVVLRSWPSWVYFSWISSCCVSQGKRLHSQQNISSNRRVDFTDSATEVGSTVGMQWIHLPRVKAGQARPDNTCTPEVHPLHQQDKSR
jgi:hypothetical protein